MGLNMSGLDDRSVEPPGSMLTQPLWRSPFTDIAAPLLHCDYRSYCRRFEADYMDCREAYGHIKGKTACKDYFDDLQECILGLKQDQRVRAMISERWNQYVRGQLGLGPEVQWYADPPKLNSWGPSILDNDA